MSGWFWQGQRGEKVPAPPSRTSRNPCIWDSTRKWPKLEFRGFYSHSDAWNMERESSPITFNASDLKVYPVTLILLNERTHYGFFGCFFCAFFVYIIYLFSHLWESKSWLNIHLFCTARASDVHVRTGASWYHACIPIWRAHTHTHSGTESVTRHKVERR